MSEYSHFMSLVLNLKNKNDVVDLLRREGIYDGVSQKEVVFFSFFNLIHVYYMHCNLHAQFQPTGIRMCVVFPKILYQDTIAQKLFKCVLQKEYPISPYIIVLWTSIVYPQKAAMKGFLTSPYTCPYVLWFTRYMQNNKNIQNT